MKFKYSRWDCKPTEAFPTKYSYLRPVIKIVVEYNDRHLDYGVLLDTGSDWCLFPASVGEYLGMNIEQGKQIQFKGASGFGVAYFHEVTLKIGGWPYNCHVGFSRDLDAMKMPYGVLGHEGFFDRYEVVFNQKKETIDIKKID